ncbi:MAG: restriction endonuclease [Fusobacterium sp.]|uniref:restriction endonuclease n=1 Tax=Fusobacterium sp. TaxID=68766 RepID=UPI002E763658|nr:restriction endonuclease [Fusobacterium sp.]MEE1476528.1 restriction endonuclease [Fusobacterium sp.]
MKKHTFTLEMEKIIKVNFPEFDPEQILEKSELLRYINEKTKSVDKGSKARANFGSLYAIYVLVEDYVNNGFFDSFLTNLDYSNYEGAQFTNLIKRMRELPFGSKLQNHALNSRVNSEFHKFFFDTDYEPIIRDQSNNRYWINEKLLKLTLNNFNQINQINIAQVILQIINKYIEMKQDNFENFIFEVEQIKSLTYTASLEKIKSFLKPNVDARIFEIVSFSILKHYYSNTIIYWYTNFNFNINSEIATLYKTGRTNANDGGIDFVMKPLGRFFQVTEVIDVNKYFLDIDKVNRYPVTFVVKSEKTEDEIKNEIQAQALKRYSITKVVNEMMNCIEEIINIPKLLTTINSHTNDITYLNKVVDEIILQSKIEFNKYEDEE